MSCDKWQAQLDAWVDGELPPDGSRDFREHLRSCAECSAAALDAAQLKRAVAHASARYTPSDALRARIAGEMRPKSRARWTLWPVAAAVAAVLIVAAGLLWTARQQSRRTWQEVADLHVTDLASATPVEVVSSDRHTVKPWFQGKLPFSFNLPELGGTDFVLVGGRMAFLDGTPAAHLLFSVRKHYISVFIANAGRSGGEPASFNGTSWTQDGLRYYVVTDASAADVAKLEELLKGAK